MVLTEADVPGLQAQLDILHHQPRPAGRQAAPWNLAVQHQMEGIHHVSSAPHENMDRVVQATDLQVEVANEPLVQCERCQRHQPLQRVVTEAEILQR